MFKKFSLAACLLLASGAYAQEAQKQPQTEKTPQTKQQKDSMNIQAETVTIEAESVEVRTNEGQEFGAPELGGQEEERGAQQEDIDVGTQRTEADIIVEEEEEREDVDVFALRPSAGAIFFEGEQKFAGGVLMDFNVLGTTDVKVGPEIGAIYSSTTGADFFDGVSTNNNDYIFQIPANLKLTFAPDAGNRLHLGVHGGANVIRSTPTGGEFGVDADPLATTDNATWDVHPNVGANIDYALSGGVDLSLRPDVTFLQDFNLVTTTLGLALKL